MKIPAGSSRHGPCRFALLAVLLLTLTAHAQTNIGWFTLDAGGGAHTSANYLINFTVGQNEVGSTAQSSANYRIVPGFWALEDMGPVDPRPELSIVLSGSDVILSWPSPSTGYVLQQADSFDILPASWSNTVALINDNGVLKSVTVPHNTAKRFYRLRRP